MREDLPTGDPRPVHPDRLELGEGIRWTGSGAVLVGTLAGRLLSVPDAPGAPLRTAAQLPVPLGAVAPLAGHAGTWVAAAGAPTPACRLDTARRSSTVGDPA